MSHDPFDLRGQDAERQRRADLDKQTRLIEIDDLRWLMGSKRGRRVTWRLLERTGIFRSSFTGNSETYFREGERNIGLFLLSLVNMHCPEQYALAAQEQREHGKRNDGDKGIN